MAVWVGPEFGCYDRKILFRDRFWIISIVLIEAIFKSVVDCVNGGFADFVAVHGGKVAILNK